MLQFNRKTEYAFLAIEYVARKAEEVPGAVTSTRELSEAYHMPYPLLAKIMQQLSNHGLIKSVQGTKGGYILAKKATNISVADIVEIFDGRVAVADCFKEEKITCPQWDGCHIRDPFYELNMKIYQMLSETSIADLLKKSSAPLYPITVSQKSKEALS
ncbi:MAG: Rrf2 family transcriptional regulator [Deltaproteobacteria bacterium]|nr:MAG: Rrf2 family transcriptional regulator [Deltaproteobacteria bacterium]